MPLQTIQGLNGDVTMPTGFNFKVTQWSGDWIVDVVDTTGFDDGGFRTKEPVMTQLNGSVTGTGEFGAATTAPIPANLVDGSAMSTGDLAEAKATITLLATTGCSYAFTAVMTRVSFTRPVDGKMDVSLDFESSGPITQVWDEI